MTDMVVSQVVFQPLGGQEFRKCMKNNDWRWTRNRFHQPVKHHPPAGNQSPMTREWLGQHEMIYKVLFRTLLDGFFGPKKQTCQKQISNPVRRQNNQKFNEIHQLKDILVFFGMEHPSKRIFFKTGPQGKSEVLLAPFFFKFILGPESFWRFRSWGFRKVSIG